MLTGSLTVASSKGDVLLGVGDLTHAPRGTLHGFRNSSSDIAVHALCLHTPSGDEQYFRDVHAAVAAGQQLTVDLLADLRSHYDTGSR